MAYKKANKNDAYLRILTPHLFRDLDSSCNLKFICLHHPSPLFRLLLPPSNLVLVALLEKPTPNQTESAARINERNGSKLLTLRITMESLRPKLRRISLRPETYRISHTMIGKVTL
jgi:hypothetical protein